MGAADVLNNGAQATVTSGGLTSVLTDNAFVVSSAAEFVNVASSSGIPPTQFRILDANAPSEVMIVVNQSGAGLVDWFVIRGAEGSAPIDHAANWTAVGMATAAGLRNLLPAIPADRPASTINAARYVG